MQDQDSYTGTFVAADMNNIGATLNKADYGIATRRLDYLNTNYDSPNIFHDISVAFDGWFGHEANPVRPANLEQERTELRGILSSYSGAHPEVMAGTIAAAGASADGLTGAAAVLATRNRSQEDQQYAYRLAAAVDQGFQAYGSMRAAVQNSPVLPSQGRPRLEPVGRSIIIRSTGSADGSAIPGRPAPR